MTLTQIATLLNNTIVPNILGEGTTIAEDLRNVVDLGTALASLSASDLTNYMNDLAVGIFNTYVDSRSYKDETYDLILSEVDYGGAIQRVKAKLLSASDTAIVSLTPASSSGPDYTDGKYYATEWTDKVYTKDVAFKIKYSISTEMFKKSFTSPEGVAKMIAMIEANVDNTLKVELNGLARGILRKLILSAYSGSRYINLITTYNTLKGYGSGDPGEITLANWKDSVTFKLWVQTLILELRKYMTDMNEKYNDGTVETFCPESDTRCVLLTEFAAELDVALGSVYHKDMVEGTGEYRTINYWQNSSTSLLPQIGSGSVHDQVKETVADSGTTTTTIDHVCGVFYDRFSCFMTNKLDRVTSKYVPEEDFTTFFHHIVKSCAIDTRNTAVVLIMA